MKWIVSKLIFALLKLILAVIKVITVSFLSNFGINIGGTFPTLEHPKTPSLNATVNSFSSVMNGTAKELSLFDTIFSGARAFVRMIYVTAIVITIILIAITLIRSIIEPLTKEEEPVPVILRGVISGMCVVLSYRIMLTLEYPANALYMAFAKAGCSKKVLGAGVDASGFLSGKADAAVGLSKNLDTILSPANDGIFMKALKFAAATSGPGELLRLAASLFLLFLVLMIITAYVKLFLEVVERYILLGFMFYTSPLAFSSLTSKGGTAVFKRWLQMVFSQFMLLVSASFFLCTFMGAMNYVATTLSKHGAKIDFATYVLFIAALIAWLDIGVRVDQYLSAIGLSAAQCGSSLWIAAAFAFKKTKKMAGRSISAGVYHKTGKRYGKPFIRKPGWKKEQKEAREKWNEAQSQDSNESTANDASKKNADPAKEKQGSQNNTESDKTNKADEKYKKKNIAKPQNSGSGKPGKKNGKSTDWKKEGKKHAKGADK